ncbi:MAG: PKD domain-containing protein [Bacteroidota bacterium]
MRHIFKKYYSLTIVFLFLHLVGYAQPVANFTANFIAGCAPLVVQFTNTSSGNPTSYQWDLGNSTLSTLQNPSTSYTSPGTYTVTLTVSNGQGSNTKTITNYITVYPNPQVDFMVNDTLGCAPLGVSFTNLSNPLVPGTVTYQWNFGDGNISPSQNPTHTYATSGYYNVTLIVTNSQGCVSSITKNAYIHVLGHASGSFLWSPSSICNPPATVTFTNATIGVAPLTSYWLFGDGGTSTQTSPSHIYNSNGLFVVKLITTDSNGCLDTVSHTLSIATLSPGFNFTNVCWKDTTHFTNTTPLPYTSLSWNFGDGNTSVLPNPTHTYLNPGTYSVTLVVHNGNCVDSITHTVTVYAAPVIGFSANPLPPCPPPSLVNFTNTTTGAVSYTWLFGDGGTSSLTNPSHTYTNYTYGPPGPSGYTVTLIATSANGCKDTLVMPNYIIIQHFFVLADANGSHGTGGCAPLTVQFSSSITYNSPIVSYNWSFGDGGTSTLVAPIHTYTNVGTYQVILSVTAANGCIQNDTIQIHVGPHPHANFTVNPTIVCVHQQVHTTNLSTGATNYLWFWGDGSPDDTSFNGTHTYTTSGTYTIMLVAFNNGCPDTMTMVNVVTVNLPTSIALNSFYCDTPTKVSFTNNSIGADTYQWIFGDGSSTSTVWSPTHIYPALGNYTALLITHNNASGCTDTLTLGISLFAPTISFVASPTAICKGDSVTFTASSVGGPVGLFHWTFFSGNTLPPFINTNGTVDTGITITHVYPDTGRYSIAVFTKDSHSCPDTSVRYNYILVAKPHANFTALPVVGCAPMNVHFTDLSTDTYGATITNDLWSFGNGSTASVAPTTTNYTYNAAGVFTVMLIVTDNVGCKDTMIQPNYITTYKPDPSFFAVDTIGCVGSTMSFSAVLFGSGFSAFWDFGDGDTATVTTPQTTHAYAHLGYYTVKMVITDTHGCKDSLIKTNYIHITSPNAAFTMSDSFSVCPPLTVHFTNSSVGATSYQWSFGNGNTSVLANPTNLYTNIGFDTVRLIAISAQGCRDTVYHYVSLFGYNGAFNYAPLAGCAPLTVHFSASYINVPNVIWDFSDGNIFNTTGNASTSHTYLQAGSYVPKLILNDGNGCQNSSVGLDTIKVEGARAGFTHTPACIGSVVHFHDTSVVFFATITGVLWTFHDGTTSTSNSPSYLYNTVGIFPVTLIVSTDSGCLDTLRTTINVHDLPIIHALSDTTICKNDAATLTGTGGTSYVWSPAASVSCVNCTVTHATPLVATVYTVSGTDSNGCVNTDTVTVLLKTKTKANIGPGGTICPGDTIHLSASGAQAYHWYPGTGLDSNNIATPVATLNDSINFMVVASEGSCIPDTNYVKVNMYPKPVVNAGPDQTITEGTTITLNATGTNIVNYVWDPTPGLSCLGCNNPTISPIVTTTYTVRGYTLKGCVDSSDVTIKVICDKNQFFVPNTFTPNGDGQNDVFYPRGKGISLVKSFRVYDRWGEMLFERKGILLNDEANAWDGKNKGGLLSPDVYVYVIDAVCNSGDEVTVKGDVTVLR